MSIVNVQHQTQVTPSGGAPENPQPVNPGEQGARLQVKKSELIRVLPAEKIGERAIDLTPALQPLVETIVSDVDASQKITNLDSKSYLATFIKVFKSQYPDLDLKNQGAVRAKAQEFLQQGGGKAVRATLKLMEWEGAMLHKITGAHIEDKKNIVKNLFNKIRGITQEEIPIQINNNISPVNGTVEEQNFIDALGWVAVNDLKVHPQVRDRLIERIRTIAKTRAYLYGATGLPQKNIDLNFLTDDRLHYLATRRSGDHFINENAGVGFNPDQIRTEGMTMLAEIKKSVGDRLKNAMEGQRGNQNLALLEKRIAALEAKSGAMNQEQRELRDHQADNEIARLRKELEWFKRRSDLPEEINSATNDRNTTRGKLNIHEASIPVPYGEAHVRLLDWSSGSANAESWQSIMAQCDGLKAARNTVISDIAEIQAELTIIYNARSSTAFAARATQLQGLIDAKRNSLSTAPWPNLQGGGTLNAKIAELEAKYLRRKAVVEDPATRQIIDSYRTAEQKLAVKNAELTDVQHNITTLAQDERTTDEILAKIDVQRKLKENSGIDSNDARDVEAMNILKTLYQPDKIPAIRTRLAAQDSAAYDSPLEVTAEFAGYPPVVLQAVRLMFGDSALNSNIDPSAAKQAKALLESRWYIKVIVEELERDNNITDPAHKVDFAGTPRVLGGPNLELTRMNFITVNALAKDINGKGLNDISAEAMQNIIDKLTKTALGYI